MKYYAHSSIDNEKPWQLLKDHLRNAAKLAGDYAEVFNAREFAYICGILHDIGKYSQKFQERLQGSKYRVDHSTAGAKELINLIEEKYSKILSYCIAGHHTGLPNYGTSASMDRDLCLRLKNYKEDYSAYKKEIDITSQINLPNLPVKLIHNYIGFTLSFFIRMLYSCLVDADYIDTENYMIPGINRENFESLFKLNKTINEFLSRFSKNDTAINIKRTEVLDRCLSVAKQEPGLFTLTVPTGGGKTYSSLAFALNHSVKNNLRRIIYVIPYTSIIEQNATIFKKCLGEQNVLEHHSNYQFDRNESEDIQLDKDKLKYASENWDVPIVVTTNVQFFESLFSNKSSRCRRIHNIAKSVIIFDEAQMLPIQYLKPCLLAISELVKNYGCTAILCTATQPSISNLLPTLIKPVEIMDDTKKLYNDFKKVEVINRGELDDNTLVDELNNLQQVLCIVNTRKHASEIFNKLKGNAFHLSSLMCPIHRQNTLEEVRKCLKNNRGIPCKVVSTQLIEAGVDIDFPIVYRSIAGIDSIIQSAGRCNREGKLSMGSLFVFKPNSKFAKVRGYLERTAKIAERVLRDFKDPISLEAIDHYFKFLYDIEGEGNLDKKDIIEKLEKNYRQLEFEFETVSKEFKLIQEDTYSIVIPYDEKAEKLIKKAEFSIYPKTVARELQSYTVSIYENEYLALVKDNRIKIVNNSFYILDSLKDNYNEKTGLIIPQNPDGEAIFA